MSLRCVVVLMSLFVWPEANADESASPEVSTSIAATTIRLRELSAVPISQGGFMAWVGMPRSDEDGNLYFLQQPFLAQDAAGTARDALDPRDVLRIAADGMKRATISPTAAPRFAGAKILRTVAMTLDDDGLLYLLVWAEWEEEHGQYIVALDREGKYRFNLELDWQEILVNQFDVFESGDFLLRGRWLPTDKVRVAILPRSGNELRPVFAHPTEYMDESSTEDEPHFAHMVRGGDGRIYVTVQGQGKERDTVHAIAPTGDSEMVLELADLPGNPQLVGLSAAGNRLAATYRAATERPEDSAGWMIATYHCGAGYCELEAVYGPAPGPPVAYHYKRGDRFTFLKGKELVTMSR